MTIEIKQRQEDLTMTSFKKIVTLYYGFLANLEQPGDRIPDTESAKVMFSVTATFCLTKTKKLPSDQCDFFIETVNIHDSTHINQIKNENSNWSITLPSDSCFIQN